MLLDGMDDSYLGGLPMKILGFVKAPTISQILMNNGNFRRRMVVLHAAKVAFSTGQNERCFFFSMIHCLVGGLEHSFPYIGNVIIPSDFHIF